MKFFPLFFILYLEEPNFDLFKRELFMQFSGAGREVVSKHSQGRTSKGTHWERMPRLASHRGYSFTGYQEEKGICSSFATGGGSLTGEVRDTSLQFPIE